MRALALHGFLGRGADWQEFLAAVDLDDLRCHTPDLPGHGPDPAPVPDDFTAWVDHVRAHLDRADEPVHLLGYSMGGRLALAAAVAEAGSGRVASLTLLAASPGLADPAARAQRDRADGARAGQIEHDGLTAFLQQWYQLPLFAPAVARVGLDTLVARRAGGHVGALATALRTAGTGRMPDLRPHLAGLTIPVLAVAGDRDRQYLELMEEVARLAPRGRCATVAGAGHSLLVEAPAVCAAHWRAFVTDPSLPEGASP